MGLLDFSKRQTVKARITDSGGGLRIQQFVDLPDTPGNVGVCLSGGGSRAMTAGMGQLRALKYLQLNGKSLLAQTKGLSTVSGGSWVGQTFTYLTGVSDDAFLNQYVEDPGRLVPSQTSGHSESETLDRLPDGNLGRTIDSVLFSPLGLGVSAYILWKYFEVPSHMLWQTLVGANILKPYGLYTPSRDRAPDSLFSFDARVLKQDVLDPNPELAEEQDAMHLVAEGSGRERRPFAICNMAMFVSDVDQSGLQYLAPVQSTAFLTGITGTPGGTDANGLPPGGGGVTSFAFNSQPEGQEAGFVKLEQMRQWALTDSIGTSSVFYAEVLVNLFADWEQNPDLFTDAGADFAGDLERWLKEMVDDLGIVDKPPNRLLEGFANVAKLERPRRAQNMQQVFEAMGGNRKELAGDFHELRLEGLVPRYGYWPVGHPDPVRHFKDTSFADGGNVENTGVNGLLAYSDIDNLIAFVNSSTPMKQGNLGVFDANGTEAPGTRVVIDSQIPPLFGYQPYQEHKGYRLYAGDENPEAEVMRFNQVFPSQSFAGLLSGLWQNSGNAQIPGSNQRPAVCRQTLSVQANPWFSISGGKTVGVLWVYNNRVRDWYQRLSPDVQGILGDFDDPESFSGFPHYSTFKTELNATQINLLASLSAWNVAGEENAESILGMYRSPS
ncbi:MAG: hypothetical protein OET79_02685 [Nitrospirota bacterium]|nr:hypothetical protein [Nitrospirota bacterium]